MKKILGVLGRIALILTSPLWAVGIIIFMGLFAVTCYGWGVLVYIGTGKPIYETAETLWRKVLL